MRTGSVMLLCAAFLGFFVATAQAAALEWKIDWKEVEAAHLPCNGSGLGEWCRENVPLNTSEASKVFCEEWSNFKFEDDDCSSNENTLPQFTFKIAADAAYYNANVKNCTLLSDQKLAIVEERLGEVASEALVTCARETNRLKTNPRLCRSELKYCLYKKKKKRFDANAVKNVLNEAEKLGMFPSYILITLN